MKIKIFGQTGESTFPFGDSGPWYEFKKVLTDLGMEISSNDKDNKVEGVIANFHNQHISNYMEQHDIAKSKRILIIWEPHIVDNVRYRKSTLDQYGVIYAPSYLWAKKVSGIRFNWPQDPISDSSIFDKWGFRKKSGVIIQGNKFSAARGELYSLRRKALVDPNIEVDLYGTNWNKGFNFDWFHWSSSAINTSIRNLSFDSIYGVGRQYTNYKGECIDKGSTLQKYKISIVIENSADFVSEKLFDSIRNGCVTIYVGPDLREFGIESKSLVTVAPKIEYIRNEYIRLRNLNDLELEQIARNQFKEFCKISNDWENFKVLKNLASSIAEKLVESEP